MAQEMFLGLAVGEIQTDRLTSKLVVATPNRNSGCCTMERGSGLSLSADLTSCLSQR